MLVVVDDCMSQVIWMRFFLEAQGYQVDDSVVYQDSQSAMLWENSGQGSSGKCMWHINISYYFVMDQLTKNDLSMKYCPTESILGNYFTKPLQGALYQNFLNLIMNHTDLNDDPMTVESQNHSSVFGQQQSQSNDHANAQSHYEDDVMDVGDNGWAMLTA